MTHQPIVCSSCGQPLSPDEVLRQSALDDKFCSTCYTSGDPISDPRNSREQIEILTQRAERAEADEVRRSVEAAVCGRDSFWTATLRDKITADPLIEALHQMIEAAIAAMRSGTDAETNQNSAPEPRTATIDHFRDSEVSVKAARAVARPQSGPAPLAGGKLPEGLRPAHQRILDALAWLAAFGLRTPDRSIVAAIAGVSPRSSSFKNDVSRLSSCSLISYPSPGTLALTTDGAKIARTPETPRSLAALHEAWRRCSMFRPAHIRLLDALIRRHPHSLTRDHLAAAAGVSPSSSSFKNDVSRLSSLGVAEYPGNGEVRATRLLFPEGVR